MSQTPDAPTPAPTPTPVPDLGFHPEYDAVYAELFGQALGQAQRIEDALGITGETLLEGLLTKLGETYAEKVVDLRGQRTSLETKVAELGKSREEYLGEVKGLKVEIAALASRINKL